MNINESVYDESPLYAIAQSFLIPSLRPAFCKTMPSILYNFFFRQYRAAFLPGRIPVTGVDHPLDEKIPFVPAWVTIYNDFSTYWVRVLSFLLRRYGRRAYAPVRDFIYSIGRLYAFAAEVYSKNLSTTKRPFYIARPHFFLIHLADPHLMCIPSLHVMVITHTYTMFAAILKSFGDAEKLKPQIEEMKHGARAICQTILFVKQHSVNCIPTALYAMTRFSPSLFPQEEAESFIQHLFDPLPAVDKTRRVSRVHPSAAPKTILPQAVQEEIKSHITALYRRFLREGQAAQSWKEPLLNFLRSMPGRV